MGRVMRRRQFLRGVGAYAVAGAGGASRQQPAKLPTVGYIGSSSPRDLAFLQQLRELGWIEGRTVTIEYRAESRTELYTDIAAEFVRLKVDIIVTIGTAVPAIRKHTSLIPIVFTIDSDPVGSGLVASLARPGA